MIRAIATSRPATTDPRRVGDLRALAWLLPCEPSHPVSATGPGNEYAPAHVAAATEPVTRAGRGIRPAAPGRVIRPGSGADPQPSRRPARARPDNAARPSQASSAPSRMTRAGPRPSSSEPAQPAPARPGIRLRPGNPGTIQPPESRRQPSSRALPGCTTYHRERLPPKVPPGPTHRAPQHPLTCGSAGERTMTFSLHWNTLKRGHRMTFEKCL
jgi:hypothetical protein